MSTEQSVNADTANVGVTPASIILGAGKAAMGSFLHVPFDQIWQDDADNVSRINAPWTDKEIAGLAGQIVEFSGILHPITVRGLTNSELVNLNRPKKAAYKVVAGHGRYKAIASLLSEGNSPISEKEIPIQLMSIEGDQNRATLDINLMENLIRNEPDVIAVAHALQSLHVQTGEKLHAISARFNKSKSWAAQQVSLTKLRPEVQKKISAGIIGFKLARVLPTLSEEDQDKAIAEVEGGMSASEVEENARTKRGKKTKRGGKKKAEKAVGGGLTAKKASAAIGAYIEEAEAQEAEVKSGVVTVFKMIDKMLAGKLTIKAMAKKLVDMVY